MNRAAVRSTVSNQPSGLLRKPQPKRPELFGQTALQLRSFAAACVLVFLFVCTMEGARTRRRRTAPQAISPVGCCLELRVAAPSIRLVPWVALASCWPLPQQLLLASATGRSRRCCRSQWLGMSTVEAVDRKISWLFCFVSHGCTVSARFLHGGCYPCPMM